MGSGTVEPSLRDDETTQGGARPSLGHWMPILQSGWGRSPQKY